MRRCLREHGLSIALIALWLVFLVVCYATKGDKPFVDWTSDQLSEHAGSVFSIWLAVIAKIFLIERRSPESKNDPADDR
ncbi:MAG: hypothetical protein AB7H90_01535 [Alphaproteobacteria bacterium]